MSKILTSIVLAAVVLTPFSTFAAEFQVSGWIPYWSVKAGTRDATDHLDVLTEINPFAFVVKSNGQIEDLAKLRKSNWTRLFKKARAQDVKIIPTVMTSDTNGIHEILSNADTREDHIEAIVRMVERGKYDGVDIDYEGKKSETRDYYSTFLKELKAELGNKILSCTIEARTPPDSLYRVIPPSINYVNDYAVIGRYCDQVKIMAYDQQRADLKLNDAKKGFPYAPVADVDWVRKVVALTVQSIPKEKIHLGIPTYGRIWEIGVEPQQFKTYSQVKATNHVPAAELADDLGITPTRNSAGELSYTYIPETTTDPISSLIRVTANAIPGGATNGSAIALAALAFSNSSQLPARFNIVWWSDAEAVRQKVALAKEFGLGGVALFKIDGDEDQALWDHLD
ncbi:MAG TPA: glycosyl hydrolase family 18 protein [Candidatus Nanoarchaeia archaeon]|nr:glycosyl hydrolase family 18 protein [Candidatus Nanoarchaeia archaeon]